MKRRVFAFLLACPLLLAPAARAQTNAWKNTAELYFLGAGMSGTVGVGPVETHFAATFDQILNNLQFGAMVNYRGESKTFAVTADVMYTALGTTVDGPAAGFLAAKVDAKEWLVTATANYRVSPVLDVFVGLRLTSLTNALTLTDTAGRSVPASSPETWVDPVIGLRVKAPVGKGWSLEGYGDIGGFGVGSDFTWMLQGRVNWQISRVVHAGLGYRLLYQDYSTGSGIDTFKWNVTTQGPLLAVGAGF
ncbi:MAG: hypothetical protein IPL89_10585 [Acidobacteria bacterium]|nr:hypothetical protein [Acidobacteriota bacterium]